MNSITFFLFFIPILGLILLGINLIFAPHNAYQEKSSTFECGFHSFLGQNRTQFSISFFIFAILFLIFDLELVLALPGLINMFAVSLYGLANMITFFTILTVGFVFEIGKKALSIDSRQYENIKRSDMLNFVLDCNLTFETTLNFDDFYISCMNLNDILNPIASELVRQTPHMPAPAVEAVQYAPRFFPTAVELSVLHKTELQMQANELFEIPKRMDSHSFWSTYQGPSSELAQGRTNYMEFSMGEKQRLNDILADNPKYRCNFYSDGVPHISPLHPQFTGRNTAPIANSAVYADLVRGIAKLSETQLRSS